jgi:hypothetical protein
MASLPPEIQRVLEWYSLLLQAEFARIEADYRKEFAESNPGKSSRLLRRLFSIDSTPGRRGWRSVSECRRLAALHYMKRFLRTLLKSHANT